MHPIVKTILKMPDAAAFVRLHKLPQLPVAAIAATHRLVEIVAQLRSPGAGWPSDKPQTAENLAPYVTEEVLMVLDVLPLKPSHTGSLENSATVAHASASVNSPSRYILAEELISRLLWYAARSSEEIMRLIGGVRAKVVDGKLGACTGILRLAVILRVGQVGVETAVDLATHDRPSPESLLLGTPDAMIELEEGPFANQPISAKKLAAHLCLVMRYSTPEIRSFLDGVGVEMLEPGKTWQAGQIQLKVDFEFIPQQPKDNFLGLENEDVIIPELEDFGKESLPLETLAQQTRTKQTVLAEVNFFDEEMIRKIYSQTLAKHYWDGLIEQQLTSLLLESEKLGKLEKETSPDLIFDPNLEIASANSQIFQLIKIASNLADSFGETTDSDKLGLFPQEINLDKLTHRLLWQVMLSCYEVMQLIGGIKARVLQPESGWNRGTLQLLVTLKVTADRDEWDVDLTSGQLRGYKNSPLVPAAIVQSCECRLLREPLPVESLLKWLKRQVATTPEIKLLLGGVAVEWQESSQNWQPASLQLGFDLLLINSNQP